MKYYIQYKYRGALETIDEFDNREVANKMLKEYLLSMSTEPGVILYTSTRACKAWRNRP